MQAEIEKMRRWYEKETKFAEEAEASAKKEQGDENLVRLWLQKRDTHRKHAQHWADELEALGVQVNS